MPFLNLWSATPFAGQGPAARTPGYDTAGAAWGPACHLVCHSDRFAAALREWTQQSTHCHRWQVTVRSTAAVPRLAVKVSSRVGGFWSTSPGLCFPVLFLAPETTRTTLSGAEVLQRPCAHLLAITTPCGTQSAIERNFHGYRRTRSASLCSAWGPRVRVIPGTTFGWFRGATIPLCSWRIRLLILHRSDFRY